MNRRDFLKLLGTGAALVAVRPLPHVEDAWLLPRQVVPAKIPPPHEQSGFWHSWAVRRSRDMVDATRFGDDIRSFKPSPFMEMSFEGRTFYRLDYGNFAVVDLPIPDYGYARLVVRVRTWLQTAPVDDLMEWFVSGDVIAGRFKHKRGAEHYFGIPNHPLLEGKTNILVEA